MGNTDTKLNFRKSVVQLTTKTQPVDAADEAFWSQFWSESVGSVQDVFTLIPAAEIRALREELPSNLATLCYKAVEKLVQAADSGCRGLQEQHAALNCIRLLTRLLPYMLEDPDWRSFFWSSLPSNSTDDAESPGSPLAQSLLNALTDLLFCPEFTVTPNKKSGPDNPEDMQTIDSCEYIWEAGVGFAYSQPINLTYDQHRGEILKLLLTCFSETMYLPPVADAHSKTNQWIAHLTSVDNRHALPLFTSLLNVTCAYDPIGYGVPYNHLMFNDSREALVEVALQLLCVTLDTSSLDTGNADDQSGDQQVEGRTDNLFVNYLSRIHRDEDFAFILKGITRLLNNPLMQTYLPGSCKRIAFHQELLVFFWKLCDVNKKFMFYVLKSSAILDILVPVLCFLNDARADQSRVGLVHIGVFILLLLSGERNFGVRLNKPYHIRTPMDLPVFTGTHADFLVIVFHKLITTGHQRLQPLFDCLLTIIVNVSPYLKTLSMVASSKLVHLLEAFSTPWFLYANANNHHLVFFLLEAFNNLIQYQFDGNANLVYTIIRKRNIFHQLANLPIDHTSIAKALTRRGKRLSTHEEVKDTLSMDGSRPAADAQPGTLKASLAAVPVLQACVQVECRLVGADPVMRQTVFESGVDEQPTDAANGDGNDEDGEEEAAAAAAGADSVAVKLSSAFNSAFIASGRNTRHSSLIPSSGGLLHLNGVPRRKTLPQLMENDVEEDESKTNGHDLNAPPPPPPLLSALAQMPITTAPRSEFKAVLAGMLGIDKMTEQAPASAVHVEQQSVDYDSPGESVQPPIASSSPPPPPPPALSDAVSQLSLSASAAASRARQDSDPSLSDSASVTTESHDADGTLSPVSGSTVSSRSARPPLRKAGSAASSLSSAWMATPEWVQSWKQKLPLQTIMRLLQVLVPQVEKICIDKGLTDETEILKFLQHGTLVGLLPVPHPILIRKYQANAGTTMWFKTYMWGVVYLRNVDPPIWYDTDVKLFEIQRV